MPRRRVSYPWLLVITLGFTETVSWGVLYYAFSVLVGPMQAELGWSRGEITGAFSVGLVTLGLAGVAAGHWLDRRGPRLLMTAGSVVGVALLLLWSRIQDLAAFYVLWAAMGLCWSATLYSPAFATVTAWFRERRTEALTAVTLMAGLASTIFYPVTARLVSLLGWRDALVALAAILAAATILPHALLLRRAPGHVEHPYEPSLSLGEALRHPSFRWLAVGFFCFALGIGVNVHLVPYLVGRGYDLGNAAFVAGLVGATQLVGRIFLAPLERRLPGSVLIAGVYSLQPLAILVLLLAGGALAPFVFVLLFGAGRGADTLVRNTAVARLYGARRFASIQGVLSLVIAGAWSLGPVSLGAIYDRFGGYDVGLWLVCGASVIAAIALSVGTRQPATR
ncbi:MAG TPA: MFS transporter [Candidatus Limnocylindria bacterium]|nr:MFS transporter [Candidatus Limnocylindria bacterium]